MFTVPKNILHETQKCLNDFSCLISGNCGQKNMCPVEYANGKNVLFLETKDPDSCEYRLPFGYRQQICTCPTRFSIHSQYNT